MEWNGGGEGEVIIYSNANNGSKDAASNSAETVKEAAVDTAAVGDGFGDVPGINPQG